MDVDERRSVRYADGRVGTFPRTKDSQTPKVKFSALPSPLREICGTLKSLFGRLLFPSSSYIFFPLFFRPVTSFLSSILLVFPSILPLPFRREQNSPSASHQRIAPSPFFCSIQLPSAFLDADEAPWHAIPVARKRSTRMSL